jgi:hypothetical protein
LGDFTSPPCWGLSLSQPDAGIGFVAGMAAL